MKKCLFIICVVFLAFCTSCGLLFSNNLPFKPVVKDLTFSKSKKTLDISISFEVSGKVAERALKKYANDTRLIQIVLFFSNNDYAYLDLGRLGDHLVIQDDNLFWQESILFTSIKPEGAVASEKTWTDFAVPGIKLDIAKTDIEIAAANSLGSEIKIAHLDTKVLNQFIDMINYGIVSETRAQAANQESTTSQSSTQASTQNNSSNDYPIYYKKGWNIASDNANETTSANQVFAKSIIAISVSGATQNQRNAMRDGAKDFCESNPEKY